MSLVLTGFSINKQTQPTAGYRLDVFGAGRLESEVSGDLAPYLSLVGFGANSADTDVLTGDRDPNGVVSALPGSIYLRGNGVTSNIYVNISVGPGPGTSWTPAGSLGAVPTWAAVLGAGNLSGGTDAVMSNTDELRWIDGAAVTRRSDDLNGGEPRFRFFTAAAALAATLAVATATGTMSYTDDFTLASPSPVLTEGDDTGSPVQRKRKGGAGQTEIEWNSGGVTVWQDGVDANEDRWIARSGINFPLFLDFATQTTELRDTAIDMNAPSVVTSLGNSTASPFLRLLGGAGLAAWIRYLDGGTTLWDEGKTHNDLHWYLDRLVGGVFDRSPILVLNSSSLTQLNDDVLHFADPDVLAVFGAGTGTGSPKTSRRKADAADAYDEWMNVAAATWQGWYFSSDESLNVIRSGINTPIRLDPVNRITRFNDDTIWLTTPSVVFQVGDATGSPNEQDYKADAGSYNKDYYNVLVLRWRHDFPNDETLRWQRLTDVGAFISFALTFNSVNLQANAQTTLADAAVVFAYPSVTGYWGDSTGAPTQIFRKVGATQAVIFFQSDAINRGALYQDSDESTRTARYDAAGVFLNNPSIFNAAASVAASVTTWGDTTFLYSVDSPNTFYGAGGGSPVYQRQKNDAGSITDTWVSNAITRGQLLMNAAEEMDWRILTAAGANDSNVRLFVGGIVAMDLPSTQLWVGDWNSTGSPQIVSWKGETGTATEHVVSAAVMRYQRLVDAAEDVYLKKFTAAGALETEIAMFATGFVRMQTHWAVTDAITAPAALAGYAKFFLETGLNGRPQLLEGDGAKEQLGVGITSQAFPVVERDAATITIDTEATETDIFNFSIPANALGATGFLRLKIAGLFVSNSGTLTMRIYFPTGVEVWEDTSPNLGEGSTYVFRTEIILHNKDATSTQFIDGWVSLSGPDTAETNYGAWAEGGSGVPIQTDLLAVAGADTTAAQVLRVTLEFSNAGGLVEIYTSYATLAAPG